VKRHTCGYRRVHAGFTLVEVLIALSLLLLLSLLSYRGISALRDADVTIRHNADRLRTIERFLSEFENDVSFAMPRRAWNHRGELEPAFLGRPEGTSPAGYQVSLSHFATLAQETPYRISYIFSPPTVALQRHSVLDPAPGQDVVPVPVLNGLKKVSLRFLDRNNRWQVSWPPSSSPNLATAMPRAVELTLDLDGLGTIHRLIARP
jgi:general secretion pathway protein J